MLSDSLFEGLEVIYEAIKHYDYSDDFKEELIGGIARLEYVVYKLDRLKRDQTLSFGEYRSLVVEKWDAIVLERDDTSFRS